MDAIPFCWCWSAAADDDDGVDYYYKQKHTCAFNRFSYLLTNKRSIGDWAASVGRRRMRWRTVNQNRGRRYCALGTKPPLHTWSYLTKEAILCVRGSSQTQYRNTWSGGVDSRRRKRKTGLRWDLNRSSFDRVVKFWGNLLGGKINGFLIRWWFYLFNGDISDCTNNPIRELLMRDGDTDRLIAIGSGFWFHILNVYYNNSFITHTHCNSLHCTLQSCCNCLTVVFYTILLSRSNTSGSR